MNYASKLLGVASISVLVALGASPAYAAGTLAGTSITNTAQINYSVNNVAQTAGSASNTVLVDRKVIFTVTNVGATTTVTPGQSVAYDTFTVANASNDTLDFSLSAVNQAIGASAQHGGTDAFGVSGFTYFIDTNGNGTYDSGTDQQITYLDEVAPDTSKTVFVVASVPLTATNTQVSGIVLTAQGQLGGTSGTQGANLVASTGAWTPGTVQTIFADAAGTGGLDAQYDDKYSAKGDYTVYAPVLTLTKQSSIISDPINGTTNPKSIPGATIEYCIVVQNGSGGAPTTALSVSDPLPTTVTYLSSFGIVLNGTYTGTTCNTDGTTGTGSNSSFATATSGNSGTANGTLNNVSAGGATTMRIRATIN
ncbi:hypothetical protein [Novosphingobium sp.]|uniref:hypothetical protein n=1 Tax=Novosphingobium sp. TaxID=1874826 RepID=UPI003D0FDC66